MGPKERNRHKTMLFPGVRLVSRRTGFGLELAGFGSGSVACFPRALAAAFTFGLAAALSVALATFLAGVLALVGLPALSLSEELELEELTGAASAAASSSSAFSFATAMPLGMTSGSRSSMAAFGSDASSRAASMAAVAGF